MNVRIMDFLPVRTAGAGEMRRVDDIYKTDAG